MPRSPPTFVRGSSPKSKNEDDALMFFIDKKGDYSKTSTIEMDLPIIPDRSVALESPIDEYMLKSTKKKVIVYSTAPTTTRYEDESDYEENIMFTGHGSRSPSCPASSAEDDSDDEEFELESDEYVVTEDDSSAESEADSDYIQNIHENNEDAMLEYLEQMNLQGLESSDDDTIADDEEFAAMAKGGSFMLRSPSTLMEYSLDETAAEFLSQKRRPLKGKGKKGKAVKDKDHQMVDFFEYDGPNTVGAINFRQINREIKAFINDDVESELEMDPMPPLPRKFLHEIAHMYGLKSKSDGKGRQRHCVLYKNERSCHPRNSMALKQLLNRAEQATTWMDKSVSKGKKFTQSAVPKHVKENRGSGKKGGKGAKSIDESTASTKPAIGTIVGKNAKPITDDNIGNKLLQKLGWKPGEGLGAANEGIVRPIDAVVRGKRAGLGHSNE